MPLPSSSFMPHYRHIELSPTGTALNTSFCEVCFGLCLRDRALLPHVPLRHKKAPLCAEGTLMQVFVLGTVNHCGFVSGHRLVREDASAAVCCALRPSDVRFSTPTVYKARIPSTSALPLKPMSSMPRCSTIFAEYPAASRTTLLAYASLKRSGP